jgi:3-keto steroid reductase
VSSWTARADKRYPHITTLYLNAGYGAFIGIDYIGFAKQALTEGYLQSVTHPTYNTQAVGLMTPDGEHGMVWTTNVLAPYILVSDARQARLPCDLTRAVQGT